MKKGIIISLVIIIIFLGGYGANCLWQTVKPDSWKFYKNTINKFTTEDKDSILKTFDITLTSKAKISKFEKCEQNSGVWYLLTISDISDSEEFIKNNSIFKEMNVDAYKNSPYTTLPNTQKPYCYIRKNEIIIYIGVYFNGQRLEITDYNKGIENLFEKLWKEKQSK